ncbi:hypothetical protein OB919_12625 [Halobacteria archaeon AArc-curdl1]|uniref:Uncharacterized protein n=1 Tax=Natronosalvus hydrolyticus TaxID=2979988 RepID=A0AAP2ZBA0_9EURY|nr:hypothetical protein [Halobacteria archaeon AArc-curdl1]
MNIPTDRLLLMIIVATGFAVLAGGWAAALVRAEASGTEALLLRVAIGAVFFVILLGFWHLYSRIDEESA